MDDVLIKETDVAAENIIGETDTILEISKSEEIDKTTDNIFLSSLKELREEDIELNETAKNQKKPSIDYIRYFLLLVCGAVLVYSSYYIIDTLFQYAEASEVSAIHRDLFHGDDIGELDTIGFLPRANAAFPIQDMLSMQRQPPQAREIMAAVRTGVDEAAQRRIRFDRLRASGISSIYGWLEISGTNIDYPVVQAHDNDFYLRRNAHGHDQHSGSLFTDYRNDRNVDNNRNTIIYGHNVGNGTKFSMLTRFNSNRYNIFYDAIIRLTTPDAVYIYQAFSVHIAGPLYPFREVWWPSDEAYVEWLYRMKSHSRFQREDLYFTPETRIITLQTCTNTLANPRLVVHGVLIDVIR